MWISPVEAWAADITVMRAADYWLTKLEEIATSSEATATLEHLSAERLRQLVHER